MKGLSIKVMAAVAAAGIVSVAGIAGAGITANNANKANAAEAETHTVRIYAVLKGDWSSQKMYIHYWGGTHTGTTWTTCPEMTLMLSDYWSGLFYYDLPYNDYTTCVFKKLTGNVDKLADQSDDVLISTLYNFSSGLYKAAWVQPYATSDATKRVVSAGDIAASSAQVAAMLSYIHYDTCSSDYAKGYMAYPQINTMTISKSTLDKSTSVTASATKTTTIENKLAVMKRLYDANK